MMKRYLSFAAVAGVLGLLLVIGFAVAVSAEEPKPGNQPGIGPKPGVPAKPGVPGANPGKPGLPQGAIENLKQAQPLGSLPVLMVSGSTIYVQAGPTIAKVITDEKTTFKRGEQPASLSDVTVGSQLHVKGERDGSGNLKAAEVTILLPHVAGKIAEVGQSSLSLRSGPVTQTVKLTGSTLYFVKDQKATAASLKVGQPAEVGGNLANDGSLTALVVRIAPDQEAGKIGKIENGVITLQRGSWTAIVRTDASTTYFKGKDQISGAALKVGDVIQVEGFRNANNEMQASRVQVVPQGQPGQPRPNPKDQPKQPAPKPN